MMKSLSEIYKNGTWSLFSIHVKTDPKSVTTLWGIVQIRSLKFQSIRNKLQSWLSVRRKESRSKRKETALPTIFAEELWHRY